MCVCGWVVVCGVHCTFIRVVCTGVFAYTTVLSCCCCRRRRRRGFGSGFVVCSSPCAFAVLLCAVTPEQLLFIRNESSTLCIRTIYVVQPRNGVFVSRRWSVDTQPLR